MAARAAADQHPPVLDQTVLADFLVEGHFARHLRRMRVAYRERLEALTAAAAALLRGRAARAADADRAARDRGSRTGVDAGAVSREAAAPGRGGHAAGGVLRGAGRPDQRAGAGVRGGAARGGAARDGGGWRGDRG